MTAKGKKRPFVLHRELFWADITRNTCCLEGSTRTHTVSGKLVQWESYNTTTYAYVYLPSIIYLLSPFELAFQIYIILTGQFLAHIDRTYKKHLTVCNYFSVSNSFTKLKS